MLHNIYKGEIFMKKHILKILSISFLFGLISSTAYATSENCQNIETSAQIQMKKETQKKMNDYYKKYKNQLIDLDDFDKLSKSKQNKIEQSFGESDKNSNACISRSKPTGFRFDWSGFRDGNMIFVRKGWSPIGYWSHTGTYSQYRGRFLTAEPENKGYGSGVIYEPREFYTRTYNEAVGISIRISSHSERLKPMMNWLHQFVGKPYSIVRGKKSLYENNYWYCSLIPWKGYAKFFGMDIDADRGPKVAPDDIVNFPLSHYIAKSK